VRVSRATAEAVDRLNRLPVPTIALVQGGCFGGGTGIVAACDVVIAADNAIFSIAEVRWGLTAAIIIPQLSDAISVRQLRRYALTGERFGAAEAQRIGLAHQVVPLDRLAAAGEEMIARVLENGPVAMAETKALALQSAWGGFDARPRCPRRQPRRQAPLARGGRRPRLLRREARGALVARLGRANHAPRSAFSWSWMISTAKNYLIEASAQTVAALSTPTL
jgi:enoyl-CoA hydratase/carnithine racemase